MLNHIARLFRGTSFIFIRLFPTLDYDLKQADMDIDATTYVARSVLVALILFVVVTIPMTAVLRSVESQYSILGLVFGAIVSMFYTYQAMIRPKMRIKARIGDVEKHLVFTIQSLYIQVSSGLPIYEAMTAVSRGEYGATSHEFRRCVEEIKSGKQLDKALEDLASRNPSPYFQKVMWQIVNAIKTGGDIKDLLRDLTERLADDQINTAKSFGAKLSPLSMAYMLAAVIIPSLGTTVLITISSLPNMGGKITENTFWAILVFTIIVQLQFAMVISSSRPAIIGE